MSDLFPNKMERDYYDELFMQDAARLIDAELLEDYRGRNLLVFSSFWAIDFTCRRNPGLQLSEIVVSEG